MLNDTLMWSSIVASLGASGGAVYLVADARRKVREAISKLEKADSALEKLDHKITDLQSILTAAPPDMIATSVIATEWKVAMESLPEGSPKRRAYESRLRQLGVS